MRYHKDHLFVCRVQWTPADVRGMKRSRKLAPDVVMKAILRVKGIAVLLCVVFAMEPVGLMVM